jgi:hypothetical protein
VGSLKFASPLRKCHRVIRDRILHSGWLGRYPILHSAARRRRLSRGSTDVSLLNRTVGIVDLNRPIVLDEAQFPEFVHEEIDPGPRCANHLR